MNRIRSAIHVVFAPSRLAAAAAVALIAAAIVLPAIISGAPLWTQHAPAGTPPTVRFSSAGTYDPASGRLIVFGGDTNCTSQNDVWTLTGAAGTGPTSWSQLATSGTRPPARYGHNVVYDEIGNRLIVFGGFAGSACTFSVSSRNDVWVLTNANGVTGTPQWTQLAPSGTPPAPRVRSTAVYDPNTNRLILFGGNASEGNCFQGLADTWVLTNANGLGGAPAWIQLATGSPAPAPRSAHSAGYDPATNRMMIFGGARSCENGNNDVWVLQNANGTGGAPAWSQLAVPGARPAARAAQAGVYDPVRNQLTIHGGGTLTTNLGDIWRLDGANGLGGAAWTQVWQTGYTSSPPTPPPPGDPAFRNGHVLALDASTNALMLFGGFGWNSRMNDAWIFTDAVSDTLPPVTSAQIDPAPVGGWNRTPVTVHLSAVDASAVASITYSLSGASSGGGTVPAASADVSVNANGTTTVTYYATDTAGNVEQAQSVTVRIDTLSPLIAAPHLDVAATTASGTVVTFAPSASDANGIADISTSPASGSLFPIGTTHVFVTASDPAGNVATASFQVIVARLPQSIHFPGLFAPAGSFGSQGSGNGQFLYPNGAAFDSGGNLIVADTNNDRIQKFGPDGNWIWSAGGFNRPQDVAADRAGNVYVADYNASLVHKHAPDGTRLTTWTGFGFPTGIEVGPDGNVYIANWGNGQVFVYTADGVYLRNWSSPGAYMLATDTAGDVYVTDNGGSRVRKFGSDGTPKGVWGSPGSAPGQFLAPGGIVADAAGFVYVNDGGNGRVQQFTSDGTFVAQFNAAAVGPINVTQDGSGRLWVSDYSGHQLRIFAPYLPDRVYGDDDFTVAAGSTSALPVSLTASGDCTISGALVHLTGAGSCAITASQDGDGSYAAAVPVSRTFAIAQPPDTTPPVLSLPAPITVEAAGPSGNHVTFTATASDAVDGPVPALCNPISGALFGIGTQSVPCTATDSRGNSASGTFTVTVQDTTAPVLALPANVQAAATSAAGATVGYSATASDAVSPSPLVSCSRPPNSTFAIGTTVVNCTATDSHDNSASGSFTVTVVDQTPPTLACPAPATVSANPSGQATVPNLAGLAMVTDYTPVVVGQSPSAGTTVGLGTTPIYLTATDAAGNASTCQTAITVEVGGEFVSVTANAGETVTTDTENDGATAADPIETSVMTSVAGTVTIDEAPASSSPGEFTLLGHAVHVTAPAGNATVGPTRAIFMIDASIVPAGASASTIEVFKDGAIVPECMGGPEQPTCITSRLTLGDGDVWIEVRTFSFSRWAFGVPSQPITASSVAALVQTLPLNGGQKNSLIVKVNRGQVAAFINEVEALQRSGRLDVTTASGLIARAQAVVRRE